MRRPGDHRDPHVSAHLLRHVRRPGCRILYLQLPASKPESKQGLKENLTFTEKRNSNERRPITIGASAELVATLSQNASLKQRLGSLASRPPALQAQARETIEDQLQGFIQRARF